MFANLVPTNRTIPMTFLAVCTVNRSYHLDFKKNKHDTRIIMYGEEEEKEQLLALIERTSWEFGRTLFPENLVDFYDKVREFDKMLLKSK